MFPQPQAYVELQIQKDANFFLFCSFCFLIAQNDKLEKGLAQPLLTSSEHVQDDDEDQECDASEEASEDSRRPANSLKAAYRLLTPSVKVIRQILMDLYFTELLRDLPIPKKFFSQKIYRQCISIWQCLKKLCIFVQQKLTFYIIAGTQDHMIH